MGMFSLDIAYSIHFRVNVYVFLDKDYRICK